LRPALAILIVGLVGANAANASAASWVGTFRLPASADPVEISVVQTGSKLAVALGPGHAGRQLVRARTSGGRLAFTLPGRPAPVAFDGRKAGKGVTGLVRQGSLRGSFTLRPGASRVLPALGLYRSATGAAAAIVQARGLPTWLVELPSGDVHGLNRTLTTVGRVLGQTSGDGTLITGPNSLVWTRDGRATRFDRVVQHQD
jgi:hypothetical protein